MARVFSLLSVCLFVNLLLIHSAVADGIRFFPQHPRAGSVVHLIIDDELPADGISFQWSRLRPGSEAFEPLADVRYDSRKIDLPLVSTDPNKNISGDWAIEATVSYKDSSDRTVERVFFVVVNVLPAPTSESKTAEPAPKVSEVTRDEKRVLNSAEAARVAEEQAKSLASAAQEALEKAKDSQDPADFAQAEKAVKAAHAAHDRMVDLQKEKAETANDTFGLRDKIITQLTTREYQSPGNTDSEFFSNADKARVIFQQAVAAGRKKMESSGGNLPKNLGVVHGALLTELGKKIEAEFPEGSPQLRIRVWRQFFNNAMTIARNTIGRSEHWKRLETPSNLLELYTEIGLAIESAIVAEHEFVANYETLENYRKSQGNNNGGSRRSRHFKRCLLGL